MFESFFSALFVIEDILWSYIGVPSLVILGLVLSYQSNFVQIRKFPAVVKTFLGFFRPQNSGDQGIHPLKAFFACIGGCVGVGNVVGIATAAQIGGPGALFWIWVTAIIGMLVKYGEVYLGVKHRVSDGKGGYNGGPMYFLQRVFKNPWIPNLICLLLCVYGVEVFQFSVITSSVTTNFGFNPFLVSFTLLGLVMYAGAGGIKRVGSIASAFIPIFVVIYLSMGFWVLLNNIQELPGMLATVFQSAFTGHAAVGGFAGSVIMTTVSQGVRRACYTGDLGIGYASVIHSESSATSPEKQASLVIFDIFLDTFIICTTSVSIILVTGVWQEALPASMLVQTALEGYFPFIPYFMPVLLFLLGYSTINAYFVVGLKCAQFLAPKWGKMLYFGYAAVALTVFSFVETTQAQAAMAIAGGLLLVFNCIGIFALRKEISYNFDEVEGKEPVAQEVAILQD